MLWEATGVFKERSDVLKCAYYKKIPGATGKMTLRDKRKNQGD